MKRNFLIVAANGQLREALACDLVSRGFSVTRSASGLEAERILAGVKLDAVLIESHLPDMSAEDLSQRLEKIRPGTRTVILNSYDLVRNSPEQLQLGVHDYVVRVEQLCELLGASQGGDSSQASNRGTDALIQVIDVLVGLIELDDTFFGGTSHTAMRLAREIAEELSSDDEAIRELMIATLLRDIGKVGVDPEIFESRAIFTDEQKERMKEHVSASVQLFEHVDLPWNVLPIVQHHHERYDGRGYPDGLRGREIPLGSRIIAVVDTYIALTSRRQHRKAFEAEQALQELISQTGRQFDPEVIEAFQKVLDKRHQGRGNNGKPTVLVAEGQKNVRRLIKMRLLNEGFAVKEAKSYERALETLLKEPPDLVLADLDHDPAEAFHLFEEIRADEALRRVPFAFITGKDDRVLRIRALRQGVDDYLNKSGDIEELIARVENILTREAIRRDEVRVRPRRGITGDLENLSFPDIVQTLSMGMKTACLSICSGDKQGKVWFENGTTKDAEAGPLVAEEAFYEMTRWMKGEFVIEHGVHTENGRLNQDSMFLLMEGLRLLDESTQHEETQAAS